MSSRESKKQQARARRVAQEQAAQKAERRRRQLRQLAAVAGLAAVIVIALVLVSQGGGDDRPGARAGASGPIGVADTRAMFAGIPQNGTSLGDPAAPAVLTEFIDLQCPFCREAALQVLPGVIERYVRPGRLRLELRTLRFIGDDSVRGAKAAQAAATRDKMWNFVELWYRNQGEEESGYATDQFVRQIARGAGIDPQLALEGIKSRALENPIAEAERQASAAGIESTPSFLVGGQGGRGRRIEPTQLTFEAFRQVLDPELN